MRKTLTVISVAIAALSLAACKPFWEKEQTPPAATVATTDPAVTAPPVIDPAATGETTQATGQTASMTSDKPATPTTETPSVPAKK